MKKHHLTAIIGLLALLAISCGNQGNNKETVDAGNRILQQEDGTVSLGINQASLYSDPVRPSGNTAEWHIVISKPGRYNVWLTSATKDTMDLKYPNTVSVILSDNKLEVKPVCNRLSSINVDVPESYFLADSFMGSFFISDSGVYNIQVISEKVTSLISGTDGSRAGDDTMLIALELSPVTL